MNFGVPPRLTFAHGFTLTELAVVLAIVALLIGGMLIPLAAQDDVRRNQETQKLLNDARDTLIGFAVANGRLPCPAVAAATGVEAPPGGGSCTVAEGFLPAATIGLSPVDDQGYAIDAWGERIRYAVATFTHATCSPAGSYVFTTANCMRQVTLPVLAPNLQVCNAGCVTSLTTQAPAVIYSTGKNFSTGGVSAEERENPNRNSGSNPDPTPGRFISHEPTPSYDDIVIWLSPNILYNRMIAAGRLP
jgi:prepilin-type N-terminal cleavage/methylation domain-containing protein